MVIVKTLNGSEQWRTIFFFSFFFIEIENFRGEGKNNTTFSEKILDFYKILEESEQFFILFLKKMENLRRFFSIFEVQFKKQFKRQFKKQIYILEKVERANPKN